MLISYYFSFVLFFLTTVKSSQFLNFYKVYQKIFNKIFKLLRKVEEITFFAIDTESKFFAKVIKKSIHKTCQVIAVAKVHTQTGSQNIIKHQIDIGGFRSQTWLSFSRYKSIVNHSAIDKAIVGDIRKEEVQATVSTCLFNVTDLKFTPSYFSIRSCCT